MKQNTPFTHIFFFLIFICNNALPADKWIIITSINYPTKAVKQLAQLPDWHVVVVADKKTPTDWYCQNVDLLTVEQQKQLPFRIIKLLPWNHYTRKNIGYLYAISKGARIIYDTDDDNYLINQTIRYQTPTAQTPILDPTNRNTLNIYAYFGQPTVWPRGYPLQNILVPENESPSECSARPLIQQGLVNGDPDVDAIFRLTRELNFSFSNAPDILCLKKGTMCPFNTQSTIFHYDAFWGLIIPIATPFRVCDIWRGYITQRLLWDIGGSLGFTPPQVIQERNEHNYIHDFVDEIVLYTQADKLIDFLCSWRATQPTIDQRMIELIQALINKEFYKEKELELMRAWIDDLKDAGYIFPAIE